jgi:hypothetical protein
MLAAVTNHLSILTELCLEVSTTEEESRHDFRNVNWEDFHWKNNQSQGCTKHVQIIPYLALFVIEGYPSTLM